MKHEYLKSSTKVEQGFTKSSKLSLHSQGVGIQLKNVSVFIEGQPILKDLNWKISPQENWAVLGKNGCGKSTLLRLLAGDEFVALGGEMNYFFADRNLSIERYLLSLEDLRKSLHLVSDRQQATYPYDVTGAELVFSGFDNTIGVYRQATQNELDQVDSLLDLVKATQLANRHIHGCSSGEMRRLFLARALAGKPELLLLDEPFSGLDQESRENFSTILKAISQQGVQMILVTHYLEDILPMIQHILYLKDGSIAKIESMPHQ